jgi:hypothetical protein
MSRRVHIDSEGGYRDNEAFLSSFAQGVVEYTTARGSHAPTSLALSDTGACECVWVHVVSVFVDAKEKVHAYILLMLITHATRYRITHHHREGGTAAAAAGGVRASRRHPQAECVRAAAVARV